MNSLITQYSTHFESIVYTEVRVPEANIPNYLQVNKHLAKKVQGIEENEKLNQTKAMRVVAHF